MPDMYIQKSSITTTSNFHGVGGTNVQLDFDPHVTSVDETQDSRLILIERPRSRSTQVLYVPLVWVIDLKRIKKTFTVKGFFADGSGANITGTSPALADSALNKKKVLLAMQEDGGTVTFYYDATSYTCAINRIDFKDVESEKATKRGGEAIYEFTINLTKADLR